MSNVNTDGLPVEMQQRIAEIIEKAKSQAPQAQPQPQAGSLLRLFNVHLL